jgi:hypothetical protein
VGHPARAHRRVAAEFGATKPVKFDGAPSWWNGSTPQAGSIDVPVAGGKWTLGHRSTPNDAFRRGRSNLATGTKS